MREAAGSGPSPTRRWSTGTARSRSPSPAGRSGCSGEPVAGLVDDIAATGALLVDDDLDPVADLVRAQLLAVDRAEAARARPRPAAQPDPLGRARRLVILCVCLSPALDVTYHVDRLHPSGTTRVAQP